MSFKAIEFFSGIGAFAQAALSNQVDVIAAFDQSQFANQAYEKNYGLKPNSRNLDSIPLRLIPQADLWWLSPPCTPYSRRGRQRDVEDARAKSFLHLIECLKVLTPDVVLIENVDAFLNSKMHHILAEAFLQSGYQTSTLRLNPQMFGIPMQRPRIFLVATLFPHKAESSSYNQSNLPKCFRVSLQSRTRPCHCSKIRPSSQCCRQQGSRRCRDSLDLFYQRLLSMPQSQRFAFAFAHRGIALFFTD